MALTVTTCAAMSCRLLHPLGRAVWVAVLCTASGAGVAADRSADLSAEERLEAVRHELLQTAMQGATQVRSTSWIDSTGALRESSSFRHGLQVRGVKVLGYQRNGAGEPRAQVQWQGQDDLLKPTVQSVAPAAAGHTPVAPETAACTPSGLRHVLNWSLETAGSWPMDEMHLVRDASQALSQHWPDASARQRHWRLADQLTPTSATQGASAGQTYLRALTAPAPAAATAWTARIRLQQSAGPAASGVAWLRGGQPPWPSVRVWLSVTGAHLPQPVFEASADVLLLGQGRSGTRPQLAPAAQEQLGQLLLVWAQTLGERLACQPVQVQVVRADGERVQVDQGELAGLRTGQEWLLSDGHKVPQHVLEPGAAERLVLARVERVGPQRAELQVLAGPSAQVGAHWQAWPMQAASATRP